MRRRRFWEHDPFGQGLLEHVARTPEKTRAVQLRHIEDALKLAIPQFSNTVRINYGCFDTAACPV